MKAKQKLAEDLLRKYIRTQIKSLMEAEEQEETPAKEQPAQEEPETEEAGLSPELQKAVNSFVAKLKNSTDSVGSEELVDMIGTVITAFVDSSEIRMNILKNIKTNIVR